MKLQPLHCIRRTSAMNLEVAMVTREVAMVTKEAVGPAAIAAGFFQRPHHSRYTSDNLLYETWSL